MSAHLSAVSMSYHGSFAGSGVSSVAVADINITTSADYQSQGSLALQVIIQNNRLGRQPVKRQSL
jgi:hypothetical protein